MKTLFALALTATFASSVPVRAADALPDALAGTWSTVAASSTADVARTDLFLDTDGLGVLAGSMPTVRLHGADDGKPMPRAVVGMPVHAMPAGDMLTLSVFLPPGGSAEQASKAAGIAIACRYAAHGNAAAATLTCTGATLKDPLVFLRHDATIDRDVARTLASLRSQAAQP